MDYSVDLKSWMQDLTFESDISTLCFSSIKHTSGACRFKAQKDVDFEEDLEAWFQVEQTSSIKFFRRQSNGINWNQCFPKVDNTLKSKNGHFLSTEFNSDEKVGGRSTLISKFIIPKFESNPIFLEFYIFRPWNVRCHTIKMKTYDVLKNKNNAKLVFNSNHVKNDRLGEWQKIHLLMMPETQQKLSIKVYHRLNAVCAPSIDDLRVYKGEMDSMMGCNWNETLYNFQVFPAVQNGWLVGAGRVEKLDTSIRKPLQSRLPGSIKNQKYLYADFSGDGHLLDKPLRVAGVRLSTYSRPSVCVTALIWIDFDPQKTIAWISFRAVNEIKNVEFLRH